MRRVLAVHFVPCALFVTCVYALVRAGSFAGRSHWSVALPSDPAATAGALLVMGACSAVLAMLLYPFQVRAVRVWEGYWDRWPFTAGLAGVLTELQRRRGRTLRRRTEALSARDPNSHRVAADAARRLAARPFEDDLLPTALGNALRAGELSAGERYGLATLTSWPRIHMQISDRLAAALRSARTALDAAVNLCWSFLGSGTVAAVALYDEPGARWLPLMALVLITVAYKGAVTAAQAYAGLMHIVYDLHRFDLLEALHHPLPDQENEAETFWRVSAFFAGRPSSRLPYDHRDGPLTSGLHSSSTGDAHGSTDA
ncbi:hypothetical protein OG800_20505 [Streptomyces sp. NBC_00445]|uniref:hypothetical protein n=1 Tax=Streptomyces sp. NBC_00445 TaxID=2975745 RepID=UPI002E1E39BC